MKIFFLLTVFLFLTITIGGLPKTEKYITKNTGVILLTFNEYRPSEPLYGKMDPAGSKLSEKDRLMIQQGVVDHFRNFDVVITTDDSLFYTFPQHKRIRCVITSDKLNLLTPHGVIPAGGISLYNSLYLGDTTATVISLPNIERLDFVSTVIAHEVGHSLGLSHQSTFIKTIKIIEYATGDSLVGPIMGNSLNSKVSKWIKGTNGFGQYQDDEEIISKTFPKLR